MSVRAIDGTPYQEYAPSVRVEVPVVDLRHLPPPDREAEAVRLAAEQSRVPFDSARPRCCGRRCAGSTPPTICSPLTLHHMVCDGWSMGVLMVELVTLYWNFVAGRPSPLPDLAIRYGDYAAWQHRVLSPGSRQAAARVLAGAAPRPPHAPAPD